MTSILIHLYTNFDIGTVSKEKRVFSKSTKYTWNLTSTLWDNLFYAWLSTGIRFQDFNIKVQVHHCTWTLKSTPFSSPTVFFALQQQGYLIESFDHGLSTCYVCCSIHTHEIIITFFYKTFKNVKHLINK